MDLAKVETKVEANVETKVREKADIIKVNYDTLVLSGGGVKGILTLGALQCAYDNFLLQDIKIYIGTSSGAIICFLLAIGYTPIEIVVYICAHQLMEKLQHFNVVAMLNGHGASSYTNIQEQLEKMTISKIGFLPTLNDLKNRFGKTFTCITYNETEGVPEYLSPDTHPNLPCITALRMSSNLPLIFEKYKYGNNFYIDGGVTNNFPIDIADNLGEKILGIQHEWKVVNTNNEDLENILEYIYRLIIIPIDQNQKLKMQNISDKCNIVTLQCTKMKFFDFSINSKTKLDLFSEGYNQFQKSIS